MQEPNAKLGWLIVIGTMPIAILGLTFRDLVENDVRQLWVIGVTLIVFGVFLGLADRLAKSEKPLPT
jgi:Uncharacterized bacitracin resistance protein